MLTAQKCGRTADGGDQKIRLRPGIVRLRSAQGPRMQAKNRAKLSPFAHFCGPRQKRGLSARPIDPINHAVPPRDAGCTRFSLLAPSVPCGASLAVGAQSFGCLPARDERPIFSLCSRARSSVGRLPCSFLDGSVRDRAPLTGDGLRRSGRIDSRNADSRGRTKRGAQGEGSQSIRSPRFWPGAFYLLMTYGKIPRQIRYSVGMADELH